MTKATRTAQDLLKARRRFGDGPACTVCGQPTDGLATRCDRCIEACLITDELGFMQEVLLAHPARPIQTAHDPTKRVHLVTFRYPHLGWCGAHVSQMMHRREFIKPGLFPPGLCPACIAAYEEM